MSLAAVLALASAAVSSSSAQNPTLKTAMRTKLLNAQPLLEAVVTADFAAIARSAGALDRISETEIVSWQANPQPEYRRQAMAFVLAVQGLREAAAKRDIDGVLAEYTELVSSCTRCHAHVRKSRVVSFEPPPVGGVGGQS
jgi:cytochrome c556